MHNGVPTTGRPYTRCQVAVLQLRSPYRRTTTLNGTPGLVGLSPSDVHGDARSLLQNRSPRQESRSPERSRRGAVLRKGAELSGEARALDHSGQELAISR